MASAGANEGTVIIADEQTAGRGRLDRRWVAPVNTCVLASVVFRPRLAPRQATRLTMLCSLAVVKAIEAVTGLVLGIKWPNDVVVMRDRAFKLAGILTETALTSDQVLYAVVGIGINVNVDPAELGPVVTPATSLRAELGRPVDRVDLLASVLAEIDALYAHLAGDLLPTQWAARLVTLGQTVRVAGRRQELEGIAEGVDADGALIVRDLAGNLHTISAGEVSQSALSA